MRESLCLSQKNGMFGQSDNSDVTFHVGTIGTSLLSGLFVDSIVATELRSEK